MTKDQERLVFGTAPLDGTIDQHRYLAPPLVSVIVTNYNYGRFLRDAVNTVFAQTYPHIECIIIDDASTDDSSTVLDEIAATYPAAKIWRRSENGGQLAASLDGLAASTGQYVLFLDADDLLLEECVATHVFVNLSLRFPVGFTCCDMLVLTGDRLVRGSRLAIAHYVSDGAGAKLAPVRPIPQDIAGGWISKVDPSIANRLYYVDTTYRGWPWSQTSGMFFRRDALDIWANMPGLADLRRSTDGIFARGLNALTGSVVIDQSLAIQRIHGANSFFYRGELTNLVDFEATRDEHRVTRQRTALLDEVMRDPERFPFYDRSRLKTVLETFDTPDDALDAPEWAKSSRLSRLLLLHYPRVAAVLGETAVVDWMRERRIPEPVLREAGLPPAGSADATKLPLLSFVVVNYNYGRFLIACVESIMSQSYGSIECIVVDNASTDGSRDIIDGLARRYPSLKVLWNDKNIGQGAACCAGYGLCEGSYIAFVDADDYLLPDFAATHICTHLTLTLAVGFTSSDMMQCEGDSILLGYLSYFGKKATGEPGAFPIGPEHRRDIDDIDKALGGRGLAEAVSEANLSLVPKTNIDWVWSPTSGTVYRRDAVRLFADNPKLKDLRLAADCYFNFSINALTGSVLIKKPLAVYRIHESNNFTKRGQLNGMIGFVRGTDEGARATLFALEHTVCKLDEFIAQSAAIFGLLAAMRTLLKKIGDGRVRFSERVLKLTMKSYFSRVVKYHRGRFERLGHQSPARPGAASQRPPVGKH